MTITAFMSPDAAIYAPEPEPEPEPIFAPSLPNIEASTKSPYDIIFVQKCLDRGMFFNDAKSEGWKRIGFFIKGYFGDNEEAYALFDTFSQMCPALYTARENRDKWDGFAVKGEKYDSFGIFVNWAKKDNAVLYKQISEEIKTLKRDEKSHIRDSKADEKNKNRDIKAGEKSRMQDAKKESADTSEALFTTLSQEFEKTHTKIINDSVFVKQLEDRVIIMSKKELITSYEHIQCGVTPFNNPVSFIGKWTNCNDNINKKDSMQIYPNADKCPDNVFNLWRPFAMETHTSPYESHTEGLEIMLKHINILCDNDKLVYDYFIGWIAMMIQKPEIKTTCITLISKEGAGKGTLMQLFAKMLGESKILETKTPSRDVWGQFNGIMADAFLVNLNEMEYKETQNAEGQIKALITDTQMTISKKGTNQFSINSYHHFIITTNKANPIGTTKDDRRKLIIRSSDQLIGKAQYFTDMYALLDNVDFVRTCYDYFKTYDLTGYDYKNIPITEHQEDLKELSVSAPEQWLEAFTRENITKGNIELLGGESFALFLGWCGENNVKYDTTALKFGINIKNLKIEGVEKGRHTDKGATKIYNISKLKKHFKLGCLVEF